MIIKTVQLVSLGEQFIRTPSKEQHRWGSIDSIGTVQHTQNHTALLHKTIGKHNIFYLGHV